MGSVSLTTQLLTVKESRNQPISKKIGGKLQQQASKILSPLER